jgi:carboxyl-terminal processing protease
MMVQAAPADGPATTQPAANAKETEAAGIDLVLGGKFDQGLADLKQSYRANSTDANLGATLKVLQNYQTFRAAGDAERATEYQATVARVQRCMLAQKLLPELAAEGIEKALRDKAAEVLTAYNKIALSDAFEDAAPDQASKMRDTATKSLADALTALAATVSTARLDKGQFSATFLPLAQNLQERFNGYLQAWKAIDPQTDASRRAGAKQLSALEDDLADAMSDLESMVSEAPWRLALMHARLAKEIALPSDKMTEQEWYKSLMADAEARGNNAMKENTWYDALNATTALEEMDDGNQTYRQMSRTTRLHVRMLRLYGGPDAFKSEDELTLKSGASKPSPTSQPADQVSWKDLTEGVDAEMVRSAINKLNESYWATPDYRKVTQSGLLAIKVLADTPQDAFSFPKLKDAALKAKFLAAVDRQMENVAKKDNVDYLDLEMALNRVIDASADTVAIPVEVVSMEFCDGYLDELDKFSNMIWPHDVPDFLKQMMGHFCGVGIQIQKDPGEPLKVVSPLPGSPAHRAGIKTGDFVLSVNGQATRDMNLDKLVEMIMGEAGTKVKLMIQRRGVPEPFPVELTREEINIRTVKGWKYLPNGDYDYMIDPADKIAYIRLTQFTQKTADELDEVLTKFKKDGGRSLILDLRFNPGGLLTSADTVASEFIAKGTVVSTRGAQSKPQVLMAQPGGSYIDGDLVVLVNEYSASAAEIVSGALKDWRRSVTVGQRSYGKGSVQKVLQIPRHTAYMKLTTDHYYLPSGRCLHRNPGDKVWGVDPDMQVLVSPRQMKRWLDIRRKTDLLQDTGPGQLDSDLTDQYKADIQLNAAVTLLKLMKLRDKPATAAESVVEYKEPETPLVK